MAGRLGTAVLMAVTAWGISAQSATAAEAHAAETTPILASIPDMPHGFPPRNFPPGRRRSRPEPGQFHGPPIGNHPRPPRQDQIETFTGYVFLNGEYVEPPYRITLRDQELVVNGQATGVLVDTQERPGEGYPDEPRFEHPGRRFGRRPGPRLPPQLMQLHSGNVVVLFAKAEPVSLEFGGYGKTLLKALNDPAQRDEFFAGDAAVLIPEPHHEQWRTWLTNYTSPITLRNRSEAEVTVFETEWAAAETRAAAYHLLDRWNFPLNIGCVFLVLAACGHLFASSPYASFQCCKLYSCSRPMLSLGLSLGFVFVLSALDLLWTVLLSQAGMMEEANPVARLFIEEPTQLAVFKSVFTCGSMAIIAGLHRFQTAQRGAWWACLICTLLAARWLAFHTLAV